MAVKAELSVINARASGGGAKDGWDAEHIKILANADSGAWTLANCDDAGCCSVAKAISKSMKTQVVFFTYDAVSGFVGYDIYERGDLVEFFEVCEAFPECSYEDIFGRSPSRIAASKQPRRIHFVSRDGGEDFVTFESTLVDADEKRLSKTYKFLDARFKELGIALPAECYSVYT